MDVKGAPNQHCMAGGGGGEGNARIRVLFYELKVSRYFCSQGIWVSLERGIFELSSASISKRVQVRNFSYENKFDLHLN